MMETLPRPYELKGCAECGSPATHKLSFAGAIVHVCQDHTTAKKEDENDS